MAGADANLDSGPALTGRTSGDGGQPPAIIAGLDTLAGLQIARILRHRGVPIIGIASNPRHFSCSTRACRRIVQADTSGPELLQALDDLAALGDRGVVIPCVDETVFVLARDRERVEAHHVLPLAPLRVLETLADKAEFARHMTREGLPAPRTVVVTRRVDAEHASASLEFPVALKPALRTEHWLRNVDRKGFKADTPDQLLEIHDRVAPFTDRLVVQEWVPGDSGQTYLFRSYFGRDGGPLVVLMARRMRQWPPDVGAATSAVACRNDVVERIALQLFEGIGYYGFAMLEAKRDSNTGEHLVLEANVGRPTAMTGMAEREGVELQYAAYRESLGQPLPRASRNEGVPVKAILLRNDIRAALRLRRQGRLTPRAWIRSLRGPTTDVVLSIRDPGPFVVDLMQGLTRASRRLRIR